MPKTKKPPAPVIRRRGRPASENPASHAIAFRLTIEQYQRVESYRDSLGIVGLSVADAARHLLVTTLSQPK